MAATSSSTAASIMEAIADRAEEIMHQERHGTTTGVIRLPCHLNGRVFHRLREYGSLPPEIKAHTEALTVYLASPQVLDTVFAKPPNWPPLHRPHHHHRRGGSHYHQPIGPVVKGNALVEAIVEYLVQSQVADPSKGTAAQLAELLVLSGFISPVVEPDEPEANEDQQHQHQPNGGTKHTPTEATNVWIRTYIQEKATYELVAPSVVHSLLHGGGRQPEQQQEQQVTATGTATGEGATPRLSVWDVADGATRAGFVFRKQPPSMFRSFVGSLSICFGAIQSQEKQGYVVVNRLNHGAVVVFADDVARQEIARVALRDAMVQYESGSGSSDLDMYHGLKLWTDDHSEYLDFMSNHERNEWLLAFLDGGAKYKETNPRIDKIIASKFYDLLDVDAIGTHFRMGEVASNKVVLLVNVASNDPEAVLQYPELVTLANKYKQHGLTVLVCPSDQFLQLELATEQEVVSHIQHVYNARLHVLAKRDVNGPRARDPFLYCNAHLRGVFGPFTEWNFTKFLIDRKGKPYRRYETRVLPLEMESDIRKLLGIRHHRDAGSLDQVARDLLPEKVAASIEAKTKCGRHGLDSCVACSSTAEP